MAPQHLSEPFYNTMDFLLNVDGKCTSCSQPALNTDIVTCCACSRSFHAICTAVTEKSNAICNLSFLKLFRTSTTKSNFKWFCDVCLTNFETNKTTTVDERFNVLANQIKEMAREVKEVKNLSKEVNEIKNLIITNSSKSNINGSANANSSVDKTMWSDEKRTCQMKSSLVIKHKNKDISSPALNLNVVKEIAVKNNIPVSNIGVSQKGDTFIHCPSAEARDKLQPLISADLPDREVTSIKDKSPHITIVDIIQTGTEDLTKENILLQICSQNIKISALVKSGNEFKILFIRKNSKTNKYTAVARVSCDIRNAIKSNRNQIYIGISSCRVYDRFYVKRCNNCQKFGHFKDGCPNQTVCGHCSGHHQSENCSLVDTADISKLTCTNCKDSNMPDGGNGHSTFWYKCPAYMVAQKKLKSTIPYYDGETAIGHDLNQ